MSEQKSGSGKRKIWIGGGIAAVAVVLAMSSGIDFPPGSKDTAGTIVPAQRYRAPQDTAEDVQAGRAGARRETADCDAAPAPRQRCQRWSERRPNQRPQPVPNAGRNAGPNAGAEPRQQQRPNAAAERRPNQAPDCRSERRSERRPNCRSNAGPNAGPNAGAEPGAERRRRTQRSELRPQRRSERRAPMQRRRTQGRRVRCRQRRPSCRSDAGRTPVSNRPRAKAAIRSEPRPTPVRAGPQPRQQRRSERRPQLRPQPRPNAGPRQRSRNAGRNAGQQRRPATSHAANNQHRDSASARNRRPQCRRFAFGAPIPYASAGLGDRGETGMRSSRLLLARWRCCPLAAAADESPVGHVVRRDEGPPAHLLRLPRLPRAARGAHVHQLARVAAPDVRLGAVRADDRPAAGLRRTTATPSATPRRATGSSSTSRRCRTRSRRFRRASACTR